MSKIDSDRFGALLLFAALISGAVAGLAGLHPGGATHFVESYVLPLFFVQVGIELREEFTRGHFRERKNLIPPALGATLGVALPALAYLYLAGAEGWAIPTATDITLGLAAIALFAKSLGLRARFLALATIDDLIGLLILLCFFSVNISLPYLIATALTLIALAFSQKLNDRISEPLLLLGALSIIFAAQSGLQTSVVGFVVGLVLKDFRHEQGVKIINNTFTLPLFGFLILASNFSPGSPAINTAVFVAVAIRPLGKLLGIAIGGSIGQKLIGKKADLRSWALIGILGGLGLTVSFLISSLSFESSVDQLSAVVATLVASIVSLVIFGAVTSQLTRRASK